MAEAVYLETRGPIGIIWVNRPEAMNAMLPEGFRAVDRLMTEIEKTPDLRVAILTRVGARAFCAGADLKNGISKLQAEGAKVVVPDPEQRFFSRITKPIIAAVNGVCVAGGCEMLLGTDLRVAAEHAAF